MTIYNVVFIGEVWYKADTPNHEIEAFSRSADARARVAQFFANVGREGWRVCINGQLWMDRHGNYVCLEETEVQ